MATLVASSTYAGTEYPIRYMTDSLGAGMDAQSVYPTDVGPAVLGEIWAPRLFAKGLDTLELGGDGDVAFSAEGRRALTLDVAPEGKTDIVFAQPAFKLGTALEVSPGDAVALHGADLSLNATGAARIAGGDAVTMAATGGFDLHGSTVDVVAAGDVVLTSDGNSTLTVKGDRVVIKGDLEVTGVLDMAGGTGADTMAVNSNILELADTRELELEGERQGLLVNTLPDPSAGDVDEYLRKFRDQQYRPMFHANDALDPTKYATAGRLLYKGLVFNVNGGSAAAGKKTSESRMQEPFWDVSGGSMKVSRVVPDADSDAVTKLSMAFRVSDAGELEVVRHRTPYVYTDGAYVAGGPEQVQCEVLARWGHARPVVIPAVLIVTVDATYLLTVAELQALYADGEDVQAWGAFVSQSRPPTFDETGAAVRFMGLQQLVASEAPEMDVFAGGGLTIVIRMTVVSNELRGRIILLQGGDSGRQISLATRNGVNKLAFRLEGVEKEIMTYTPGVRFTLAVAYDAVTGVARAYVDGDMAEVLDFPTTTSSQTYDKVILGASNAVSIDPVAVAVDENAVATDTGVDDLEYEIDHIQLHGRPLAHAELRKGYV